MPKVVSIIGYTRSGSTLLDSILGELDGWFSTGELHYLWERGLLEGRKCGCGRAVPACPVWSEILDAAFGAERPDPRDVMQWQERTVRTRHTLGLLGMPSWPIDRRCLGRYRDVAARLYHAIADVTGADVVVDSSKRPSDGALLRSLPGIDAYFIHLVRDPRGIVFSWSRRKRELDTDRPSRMPRQNLAESVAGWIELNLAAGAVRRWAGPERSLLVRYEDFMSAPRRTIAAIADLVGYAGAELPLVDERTARLTPNHTVAGNPGRFSTGLVPLHTDVEWKERIRPIDRWLTTIATAPLLRRYGYPVRTS